MRGIPTAAPVKGTRRRISAEATINFLLMADAA
jgi:hypothetical protein